MSPNHLLSPQQPGLGGGGCSLAGLPYSALPLQSAIDIPTAPNSTVEHHTPSQHSRPAGNADFGAVEGDIDKSEDPTGPQCRSILADDERVARLSRQELLEKKDWRMLLILEVIMKWAHPFSFGVTYVCSRLQDLWCRIIEGDSDEDFWLWADGDEDWLRKRQPGTMLWWSANLRELDWDRAQSALRRRISQQRYPPATGPSGSRNERVRNATLEQRFAAIVWLLSSSKGMAELTIEHGYTPPTFRISRMTSILSSMIGSCWVAFPAQTGAWEKVLMNSESDGCICLRTRRDALRTWFDMLVWLEGIPPSLEGIDDESCMRCRTLVQSRYHEDLAIDGVVRPDSQLWNIMCYHAIRTTRRDNAELLAISSKRISQTGKRLVERTLNPVLKRGQIDLTFAPHINEYPKDLRFSAAQMSCILPADTQLNTSWPVQLPDNVLEDANDPWIMLGIIAWMSACCRSGFEESTRQDRHDERWHTHYLDYASEFTEFLYMPGRLPRLSAAGIELCHRLRISESDRTVLSQFGSDPRQWCLIVYVAVAMFLRSRDVNLPGCQRCRVLFERSCTTASPTLKVDVTGSGEPQPTFPTNGADDAQRLPDLLLRSSLDHKSTKHLVDDDMHAADKFPSIHRSNLPVSGPTACRSETSLPEPAGMEAFTSITHNKTLSKNEMQSRLTQQFHILLQYVDFLGLDTSTCFRNPDGDNTPYLGSPTEKLPAGGLLRESLPDPSRLTELDMIETIKDKFLEMLRELDLPCEHLPWYTLEKDLEEHGFVLVNWPAGVRKRGNKGIRDLSTADINSLYQAIMHSDEASRLRICRRPPELTVVPANYTLPNSSSSKRPMQFGDSGGHPPKRTRFKEETTRLFTPSLI